MKKHLIRLSFITAMGLISFGAYGQQAVASASQSPTAAQIKIDPGTLIQVEMNSDIDVKKAHAGDIFRTRLWDAVRNGGKVILPQKTIVVGHVVEAQRRTKDNPESKLTITFDKAVFKDGSELPLRGVVARVQLSQMAAAAAADANARSYNPGLSPGSTTNVAMPSQLPLPGEGVDKNQLVAAGPTNIRDITIIPEGDASGTLTVFHSATKADVKIKHFATLDVRITHTGD
ncbi:MAG TPA: hypothetical protein VN658_07220 [Candidatus Acidoferrales bacterium]|nr:hypothetical protein [Candidatus Acidoferrales bacterium]